VTLGSARAGSGPPRTCRSSAAPACWAEAAAEGHLGSWAAPTTRRAKCAATAQPRRSAVIHLLATPQAGQLCT
jgi:hypothetical protein